VKLPLVDGWADPIIILASHDNFRDLESGKVAQAKLDKLLSAGQSVLQNSQPYLRYSLLMQLVHCLEHLRERKTPIRGMQVEDIYTIRTQLLQARFEIRSQNFWLVGFCSTGVDFCGYFQTTLLPSCLSRESFLLATNIGSGGINLIVAFSL